MQKFYENKKITFIIPVYNIELYIAKCLDSIINQTYENIEIIVVNDGSTDNSLNILKNYSKNDNRIKIINQKNKGLSEARNVGVEAASGDYIAFVDGDDYLNKDFTLSAIQCIKNSEDVVRVSYCNIIDDKTEVQPNMNDKIYVTGEELFCNLIDINSISVSACFYIFNRNFWISHNFKFATGMLHEDYGLIPLVLITAKKATISPNSIYYYVQRKSSIVHDNNYSKKLKKSHDMYAHYICLIDKLDKINMAKKSKNKIKSYLTNGVLNSLKGLSSNDLSQYMKKLKDNGYLNNLQSDSFFRKIKKILLIKNYKVYFKLFWK